MLTNFPKMFWRHRIYPNAVLHIGGHLGQESDFYAEYCAGPVVWIEALPKIHARLVANIAKYPNQRALCACVSDTDGAKVPFKITDDKRHANQGQSSSMLTLKLHSVEHPEIKVIGIVEMVTIRVDTLLAREGIEMPFGSFLNVDIQGADGLALRGMLSLLPRFDAIHCEFNEKEMYENCILEPELDAMLAAHGFVSVDRWPTKHGWGDKLYRRSSHLPNQQAR